MKEMIRKVMEWCKLWNGEAATAKQADPSSDKREKEQAADNREVQDRLENYLWKHYEFRFNVLTEQPEYCAKGQGTDTPYKMYLANLHTSFLCNLIYPTFSRILLYSC